jgi:hypothetical protein
MREVGQWEVMVVRGEGAGSGVVAIGGKGVQGQVVVVVVRQLLLLSWVMG